MTGEQPALEMTAGSRINGARLISCWRYQTMWDWYKIIAESKVSQICFEAVKTTSLPCTSTSVFISSKVSNGLD
ncbi:hypothetical protein chiPu_0018102 [Chiloscyllium punctatum]|uniref:Uncharacterized protein n=1 Tax=Chiloscyllium punctatum TaxID=137246 RepID=A0A401RL47_CHIPU|nr:hypothetical protein [Chiloscyllium punctatum]